MTGTHGTRKRFATCRICGKRIYHTRKEARRVARTIPPEGGRLNAYRSCGTTTGDRLGDDWHLGHLPTRVRYGDLARDEMNPERKPR